MAVVCVLLAGEGDVHHAHVGLEHQVVELPAHAAEAVVGHAAHQLLGVAGDDAHVLAVARRAAPPRRAPCPGSPRPSGATRSRSATWSPAVRCSSVAIWARRSRSSRTNCAASPVASRLHAGQQAPGAGRRLALRSLRMASSPLSVVSTRPRSARSWPRSRATSASSASSERCSETSRSLNCLLVLRPVAPLLAGVRHPLLGRGQHRVHALQISSRAGTPRGPSRPAAPASGSRRAVTSAGVVGSAASRERSAVSCAWICPSEQPLLVGEQRVQGVDLRRVQGGLGRGESVGDGVGAGVPSWSEGKASAPRSSSALRMRSAMAWLSVDAPLPPSSDADDAERVAPRPPGCWPTSGPAAAAAC